MYPYLWMTMLPHVHTNWEMEVALPLVEKLTLNKYRRPDRRHLILPHYKNDFGHYIRGTDIVLETHSEKEWTHLQCSAVRFLIACTDIAQSMKQCIKHHLYWKAAACCARDEQLVTAQRKLEMPQRSYVYGQKRLSNIDWTDKKYLHERQ